MINNGYDSYDFRLINNNYYFLITFSPPYLLVYIFINPNKKSICHSNDKGYARINAFTKSQIGFIKNQYKLNQCDIDCMLKKLFSSYTREHGL